MNNIDIKEALANADILYKSGNIEGAFELYQLIVQMAPHTTEAWFNLGVMCTNLQRFDLAENFFQEALQRNRKNPDFFNALGETQFRLGKYAEAGENFDKALKRHPASIRTLNNLGRLHLEQQHYLAAEREFTRALRLAPKTPQIMLNLSSVFIDTERFEEARSLLEQALTLTPDDAMLRYNMARVAHFTGRSDEAIATCHEALKGEIAPYLAALFRNLLGTIHQNRNEFEPAEEQYLQALEINPQQAESHTSLGLLRVILGRLDTGWPELAWVIRKNRYLDRFQGEVWNGGSLEGKRLTCIAEQGVGDELLYANMFPDLIERAGHCTIECDQRLIPLFSRSFPSADFIARQKPPLPALVESPADFITWGSNSASHLRPTLQHFPNTRGYLTPSAERVAYWRQRLQEIDGNTKVGICWRSMVTSAHRRSTYSSIVDDWDALLTQEKLTFINLQYDKCDHELAAIRDKLGVTVHNLDLDLMNDFDEVAALMGALDLVISSHTAIAALSGAVGKETHVLTTPYNWTMLGSDGFPWYPNSQANVLQPGRAWSEMIGQLAQRLATTYC